MTIEDTYAYQCNGITGYCDSMKCITTDVLIIGSGGAGLRAAIEAQNRGAHVLLVTKSRIGRATCTAVAMGAFRVSEGNGIEKHFRETLEAGRFLNNRILVQTLVNDAWVRVKELERFGVPLLVEKDRMSVVSEKKIAGILLARALADYCLHSGIDVLERTCVIELLVGQEQEQKKEEEHIRGREKRREKENQEQKKCIGAVALNKDTGELSIISAKAVILATGGYSQLYNLNDNPPTVTGDGLVLAYRAGAELQDLEFVQFQPAFIDRGVPRMPILDWLIEATKNLVPGGPLKNCNGEQFMSSYGLLEQRILRDNLITAIEREIYEGRGYKDSVILDLTSLSPEEIEGTFALEFQKSAVRPFLQVLTARRLHIASCAHYTMGGVTIDENCSTNVKGLYAVGEVAGGIHGANRLGGNALTEIFVFGTIAGARAADYCEQVNNEKTDHVENVEKYIRDLKTAKGGINPSSIKKEVKSVVSQGLRPVRSGETLAQALDILEEIKRKATFMGVTHVRELPEAFEAHFMAELARLVVTAALTRKESRGSHFRIDYPESRKEWLKTIVITQEGRTPKIRYDPVLKVASCNG